VPPNGIEPARDRAARIQKKNGRLKRQPLC